MRIGIVGLGLIGGSLGLAIKEANLAKTVFGYDQNSLHGRQALSLGLVDECVEFEEITQCDVIILAIPVEGIISSFEMLASVSPRTTIIDVGSTKEKIIRAVPESIRKNFVAAHPMSGTEKFGPHAAIKGLYKEKIVVLCNLQDSGDHQANTARDLFIGIGMHIVQMDAHEHDRHAAFISHLPHAISYALANSVLAQEDPESILLLAAGGFKDMSRIAKSSPTMWTEIFKQNKSFLLESINHYEEEMTRCKQLIEEEKWDELNDWMKRAVTLHDIL